MEVDSVTQVFYTVEVLQQVAKFLRIKDLSALKEINDATREAVEWELSLRDDHPKTIFLGHHGPLPNLHKAHSVKLVIAKSLNESHIPFITEITQACRKSKKLILEFPRKYPDLDDSIISHFKNLKHPFVELEIAEIDLFRAMSSGIKFKSAKSLVISFNRMMAYVREPFTEENPEKWSLDVINAIVSHKDLKQFTATFNVTKEMFLRPKLKCFSHLTDLTIDEFVFPLTKINKKSFPALKSLTLVDPETRDHPEGSGFYIGFSPCPLNNLTVQYRKSTRAANSFPDLKYIFPRLKQLTITGKYLPCGALLVIQNNLYITKLCLLGCIFLGRLTTIITGNDSYLGVKEMKGLKYLELGADSFLNEIPEVISDALLEMKNLEEIHLHLSKIPEPIVLNLDTRFKCVKID